MNKSNVPQHIREKLVDLQQTLESFRIQLVNTDYISERAAFFEIMKSFWAFANSFDDEEVYDFFEHSEYYTKHKMFFSSMEQYYVRTIEAIEAVSIMTKSFEHHLKSFDLFEQRMAKENYSKTSDEIQMTGIDNVNNLVMVGCGPLPETILYLSENTDVKSIVGIDYNQEAIYMAGEMIQSLGQSDKVKLMHYNGVEYDYKNADLIIVANFISPKAKVLQRIANTAKNGAKILVRTPILLGKMLYESADSLPSRLILQKKGIPNRYFLDQSLFLEKLDI